MQKAPIAIIAVFILAGCTIVQMNKEISETEARIARKETRLGELEAERGRLEQHQSLLVEKLEQTRMDSRQLNEELDQLIRRNQKLAAMAERQGQDITEIRREIEALEARQAALSRMDTSGEDNAAKAQKIKALQQEIRNYLLLGLKSRHRRNLQ
jgi:chromosome segregation ATPase